MSPAPVSSVKEPANKNQKSEEKKLKSDVRTSIDDSRSPIRTQKRKKKYTSRREIIKHSDKAKSKNRSPRNKQAYATIRDQKRKRSHEDEEFEAQSSERYVVHGREESPVSFNRRAQRPRVSKRELESSDLSDGSDRDVNRKRVSRANAPSRREPRRREARGRSRDRSSSRARSTQQARQHPIEEVENDRHRCDENLGLTEHDAEHQEPSEDIEGDHQPNGSNSDNNLENS
ncbi:PREDICTED: pre-mRNA-splicing factor 38B-like [Dinoponera quadriceps]|uniref:Pre-mRNA-splicing factor 38B-like n=1 Tax=Dinoponera quadriceps TaxID=609295 RepID=A0A6P3XEN4_DINQU|nr:PREDICTED: pre-mRNA-splicing factor 38B-like [Dinoponera quadriceps]